MAQRYRKIENQKPWRAFSRNQDFTEEGGLEPKVIMSKSGDALSKLEHLKRITDGGLWVKPPAGVGYGGLGAKFPAAGQFFVFFGKKSQF